MTPYRSLPFSSRPFSSPSFPSRLLSIVLIPLLSALFLLAAVNNTRAQTASARTQSGGNSTPKEPNPTYLNQIYYYWSDSLLLCPKTDGEMASKMNVIGFGGVHMAYTMDGARSALRIRAADTLRFAIRSGSGSMMDPSTMFKLYKFESKKGSRQAAMSGQSRFGGGSNEPKNQVSLNVQKSGTDVFILIPAARLAPGEYGFMNSMSGSGNGMKMSYEFFTFGID